MKIGKHTAGVLASNKRKQRRDTLYKMAKKKGSGIVPCLICGKHVEEKDVSLEHIQPRSKGGTDDMSNLSITHVVCNVRRGNRDLAEK